MTLKNPPSNTRSTQGHVLVMVLVVVIICAIALMSYLTLVNSQNRAVARSQGWNSTVPVMEAGVEEALAHLNANYDKGLNTEGWVKVGNYFRMERSAGDSYYVVILTVTNPIMPVIESRGFCKMPLLTYNPASPYFLAATPPNPNYTSPRDGFIGRGVRILARKNGSLTKAMLSKGKIDIGGNVRVDSYDSCDPAKSTGGLYDPLKAGENGDIASNGQLAKQISTGGDVQIRGHVSTGPGGTTGMNGTAVAIGSDRWIDDGNLGIEPGWFRDDMNANVADAPPPPPGGFPAMPSGGWVNGTYYDYILGSPITGSGQQIYTLPELQMSSSQRILVRGDVVLKISGDLQISGQAAIEIATTGLLTMYVDGRTASIGGGGIINQTKDPLRFTYYGSKTNTRLDLGGTSAFYGTVYAPYADLNVAGGSLLFGGTVSKSVKATGGFTLHYDQCLDKSSQARYIVTSWDEMWPWEVAQIP